MNTMFSKVFPFVFGGVAVAVLGVTFFGGGFNQIATKNFGGTHTIELEQGERLVNVTWKDNKNLWLLTKNDPDSKPSTYTYKEDSAFGVLEGKVIIVEK